MFPNLPGGLRLPNIDLKDLKIEEVGPCGLIIKAPAPVYRPNELLIRLNDEALTRSGFHEAVLPMFQWLNAAGATVESLRYASIIEKSISTGVANWVVNGVPSVKETSIPSAFWISNFGDGAWVGSTANDGTSAKPGQYEFRLNIGQLVGARGFFSLFWAGDNNVQWRLIGGGTLEGDVTGPEDSFRASTGAPRSLEGTFEASSILVATVTNKLLPGSAPDSPMGLIVVGTAGAIPEPYNHKAPPAVSTANPRPITYQVQRPLSIKFVGPGTQPRIELKGNPARVFLPLFNNMVQEELRYLRVFLPSEPSGALIRCLRTLPGVKFVERIPLVLMNVDARPIMKTAGVPGGTPSAGTLKVVAPNVDGAIDRTSAPTLLLKTNLAILDGVFGNPDDTFTTHGTQVYMTALQFLHPDQRLEGWTVTEVTRSGRDLEYMRKDEEAEDPSAYFTALRDIRMRNKANFSSIQVMNISRGSWASRMEAEEMAEVEKANIVVVAAAGQNNIGKITDFPAAYATVLSVGGAERQSGNTWVHWAKANSVFDPDELAFSKGKLFPIDVVGPAVDVEVGEWYLRGTSFAAPIMAALCAVIRSKKTMSAADCRKRILQTALPLVGTSAKPEFGRGMIRWNAALS